MQKYYVKRLLKNNSSPPCMPAKNSPNHRVSILEGPRVGNLINAGGGDPLCTFYIAQKDCTAGVRLSGYMRDSL